MTKCVDAVKRLTEQAWRGGAAEVQWSLSSNADRSAESDMSTSRDAGW